MGLGLSVRQHQRDLKKLTYRFRQVIILSPDSVHKQLAILRSEGEGSEVLVARSGAHTDAPTRTKTRMDRLKKAPKGLKTSAGERKRLLVEVVSLRGISNDSATKRVCSRRRRRLSRVSWQRSVSRTLLCFPDFSRVWKYHDITCV